MRTLIMVLILLLLPVASAEIIVHAGYPQPQSITTMNAITIMDINKDNIPEIIVAPHSRSVKVYAPDGTLLWKGVAGTETASNTVSPLAADVNGDGYFEVILAGGMPGDQTYLHRLYIWNSNGILAQSFDIGNGYGPSCPAYTSGLILVGISGSYTGLYAYDMTGLRWSLPFAGGSERMNGIATGDLDGDGISEAVLAGGNYVTAVKITVSGGSVMWQKNTTDAISPVIINASGTKLVVVPGSSGTFAWDADGNLIWSSPVTAKYYFTTYSSPAVSDLNNDGSEDVIIASDYSIYALSGTDGSQLFKSSSVTWPPGSFRARPAIYDINYDSKPEIILGDSNGNLYIWDNNGERLPGFPVMITDRVKSMHSSPAVYDLEGDGTPEVAIGSATDLHVVSVKTAVPDNTPPVTTDDADGLWHNRAVTVTLTANDDSSGVLATYYTTDGSDPDESSSQGNSIVVEADGIYTIKYFSKDRAGNVEPVKTAANRVMIDTTPPVTTDNAGTQWYNGSVTVALTPQDTGSGTASTYYSLDGSAQTAGNTLTISGDGIHTLSYYSVDIAGNIEQTRETVIKIDITSPTSYDDSDNLWHNTDVTVNITVSDESSGIAYMRYTVDGTEHTASSGVQLSFSEEGIHEITYYATDNAGNAAGTRTAFVKIDKTSPVTADDANGQWSSGTVLINLMAADNLAGVRTTVYKVKSDSESILESFFNWLVNALGISEPAVAQGNIISLSDEGTYTIQYYSIDNADNTEPEKSSMPVRIDNTPPTITVTTPLPATYLHSDIITIDYTAADSLSGIKATDSAIDGTVHVSDGQAFDMLGLGIGTHEFTVTSIDMAGNSNSLMVNFNVTATIDSLRALTERGSIGATAGSTGSAGTAWITSKGVADSLLSKIDSAKQKMDAGQFDAARNSLEAYISEVDSQTGKAITTEGAAILKAEASYVINSMQVSVKSRK